MNPELGNAINAVPISCLTPQRFIDAAHALCELQGFTEIDLLEPWIRTWKD